MNNDRAEQLKQEANEIRKLIIEMIADFGFGHIGGSMSITELLTVLYFEQMNIRPEEPRWAGRDRFVLSKGHAGPALYATLARRGYFDKQELFTLNRPHTNLPSHCDRLRTVGIDMTAGSLGQGFSCACGMALGLITKKNDAYVYAVVGDGESQEGQIWETAMYAGQNKLDHFIAFTDFNKMQSDGLLIIDMSPLEEKWKAFGWDVQSIDGHDIVKISEAIEKAKSSKGKPHMIILNTIKGKGAFFAEGRPDCHSMIIPMNRCKKALEQLG